MSTKTDDRSFDLGDVPRDGLEDLVNRLAVLLPDFTVTRLLKETRDWDYGAVVVNEDLVGFAEETKFIGRKVEIKRAKDNLLEVVDGAVKVVGLIGEAGIGKSRLLRQVMGDFDQFDYLIGYGSVLTADEPYSLIKNFLTLRYKSREELQREVLNELNMERSDCDFLEILYGTLDAVSDLTSDILRKRFRESFFNYVERLSEIKPKPPVLVIEDAHTIDRNSAGIINYLAANAKRKVGIVFTNRKEDVLDNIDVPNLYSLGRIDLVPIERFSDKEAEELVHEFGVDDANVLEGAEGVPLRLEYLSIARREGLEVKTLPIATIDGVILVDGEEHSRYLWDLLNVKIDRLGKDTRKVMMAAAVLKDEFNEELIREMLGKEVYLPPLVHSRLLKLVGDEVYRIDHDIIAKAVLSEIPDDTKKELHVNAASAYERVFHGREEEVVENLVYHWTNGGLVKDGSISAADVTFRGVRYLRRSANNSKLLGAVDIAERKLNSALRILSPLDGFDASDLRLDTQMELCNLFDTLGDVRVRRERKLAYDMAVHNPVTVPNFYRAVFGEVLNAFEEGDFNKALEYLRDVDSVLGVNHRNFRRAATDGKEITDEDIRKLSGYDLYRYNTTMTRGRVDYVLGLHAETGSFAHFENARRFFSDAAEIIERGQRLSTGEVLQWPYLEAVVSVNLALAMIECEDLDGATERLEKVRRLCDVNNYQVLSGFYANAKARLLGKRGNYKGATELLERGLAVAEEAGSKLMRLYVCDTSGDIAYKMGDKAKAMGHYSSGLDVIRERGEEAVKYGLVDVSGLDKDKRNEEIMRVGDQFKFALLFERKIKILN